MQRHSRSPGWHNGAVADSPDREVLVRIDRTLDRIDAGLDASEKRWARRDELLEADREEAQRRWERLAADNRRYNDALLERHARITGDMIAALRRHGDEESARTTAILAEIADQREQIQAQTRALLQVIDRLPPPHPQG